MTSPKYIAAFLVRWGILFVPAMVLLLLHFLADEALAALGRLDAALPEKPEPPMSQDERDRLQRLVDEVVAQHPEDAGNAVR